MDVREIINSLDIQDWATCKEIQDELYRKFGLNVSSRRWRYMVEEYNKEYLNSDEKMFIARSKKGYCRTKRKDLIKHTSDRLMKQGVALIKESREIKKATGEKVLSRLVLEFDDE